MGAIIFHLRQLSQSADLPIRFKSANLESVGPTNTNFRNFYGSLNYLHQWAEAGQQSWAMQCALLKMIPKIGIFSTPKKGKSSQK